MIISSSHDCLFIRGILKYINFGRLERINGVRNLGNNGVKKFEETTSSLLVRVMPTKRGKEKRMEVILLFSHSAVADVTHLRHQQHPE